MRSESNAIWTSGEPVSLAARWNCATTPVFFSVARDIRFIPRDVKFLPYFAGANSTEKVSQSIGLRCVRMNQPARLQPIPGPRFRQAEKYPVRSVDPHTAPLMRLWLGQTLDRLAVAHGVHLFPGDRGPRQTLEGGVSRQQQVLAPLGTGQCRIQAAHGQVLEGFHPGAVQL